MLDPWQAVGRLTAEEQRSLQNAKLSRFIREQVYPFSPHYKAVFDQNGIKPDHIRTVADLKHIPFTSKKDFASTPDNPDAFKNFILQPDADKIRKAWPLSKLLALKAKGLIHSPEWVKEDIARAYRPIFMTFTTGTTSTPVPFVYSRHDFENLSLSGSRMLSLFDVPSSDKLVNMFPYAPHLAFWQVFFGGMESCVFTLSTGGGKTLGTDGNINALLKMKPSVILGVPSYVYHVLRSAQEKGADMSSVKKVVLGAAKVTIPFKQKLAGVLESMGATNVSVMGTYGFTEARTAWAECPTAIDVSSGYHLYPDREIFEVIDPDTGEVKGPGEDGELVYTALDARASVVLRYRTGDFVEGGITYEPCPHCGRTVARISSRIGRISDVKDLNLSKVKGCLVNLNHFGEILSEFAEVDEWQLEIGKKDNDPFEVDVINLYLCAQKCSQPEALQDAIMKRLAAATELTPNSVQFISMEEILKRLELETANKEKRIVDNRPKE